MLQNADAETLSVRQIAAHLRTKPWNVTNELSLGAKGERGRLRGEKKTGPGSRGAGGQWRVSRQAYLDWLGVPAEDRDALGDDGLPELTTDTEAATRLGVPRGQLLLTVVQQHAAHLQVGWRRYFTHNQMERLRVLLAEDCRDKPR